MSILPERTLAVSRRNVRIRGAEQHPAPVQQPVVNCGDPALHSVTVFSELSRKRRTRSELVLWRVSAATSGGVVAYFPPFSSAIWREGYAARRSSSVLSTP